MKFLRLNIIREPEERKNGHTRSGGQGINGAWAYLLAFKGCIS